MSEEEFESYLQLMCRFLRLSKSQREVIAEHYRLAEQVYGADRCVPTMRKFGIKYARLHPQPDLVKCLPTLLALSLRNSRQLGPMHT